MMETVEGAKKTMDIVNDTSSYIIQKASDEDVTGLQAFAIRSMDQNLPTGKNIEHYKLLNVHELPMDNFLMHSVSLHCFQMVNLVNFLHVLRNSCFQNM